MNSITYIGPDARSTNYPLCAFTMGGRTFFGQTGSNPNARKPVRCPETINIRQGGKAEFVCGYEAGRHGQAVSCGGRATRPEI